ncbi:conserved hypothetical protein [uncultured Microbacterium sp.]|uniref:site-specific DNA-methyltransferase (cytosine-N(4)-specific) n=2 Tax=uncultured Microbacterium sp. TaxID=191216 RepID=A0A1Y5P1H9_9MICO|nr:conserved hypothetical protein [uncultured Microbacterium sp.]
MSTTLGTRRLTGSARIERGDARNKALFAPDTYDLVVTSPPYLNAIDYLRGHRLALIWMGHTLSELRSIRNISIGSEAARREAPTEPHEALVARAFKGLNHLDNGTHRLVLRYAHDMLELANNVHHCLVERGRVVVVVADSVLRGNRIPTGDIVTMALADKGLEVNSVQTREIPATLRYLPVVKAGNQLSKRMKSEYIITAVKVAS